jgi:hypothetical protein
LQDERFKDFHVEINFARAIQPILTPSKTPPSMSSINATFSGLPSPRVQLVHAQCPRCKQVSSGKVSRLVHCEMIRDIVECGLPVYAADVFSFGRGVVLRYGLIILKSGNSSFACSFLTLGCTITSSPGTQLIGVVILCLSPVCSESTILRTSAVLRPVEAG